MPVIALLASKAIAPPSSELIDITPQVSNEASKAGLVERIGMVEKNRTRSKIFRGRNCVTLQDEQKRLDNDAAAKWLAKHELAERMRKAGFRPRKAKVK